MRALGKGSIASLVRVGLMIAWAALWVGAAAWVLMAGAYALHLGGLLPFNDLFGAGSEIRLGAGEGWLVLPAGAPTWPLFVSVLLVTGVVVGGGFIIVWRLRRLFDNFTSGASFAKENATHLRVIWMTMLGVEIARYLLLVVITILLAAFYRDIGHTRVQLDIDLSTWASILILIVLAEVFREGARLKEEQELTI